MIAHALLASLSILRCEYCPYCWFASWFLNAAYCKNTKVGLDSYKARELSWVLILHCVWVWRLMNLFRDSIFTHSTGSVAWHVGGFKIQQHASYHPFAAQFSVCACYSTNNLLNDVAAGSLATTKTVSCALLLFFGTRVRVVYSRAPGCI